MKFPPDRNRSRSSPAVTAGYVVDVLAPESNEPDSVRALRLTNARSLTAVSMPAKTDLVVRFPAQSAAIAVVAAPVRSEPATLV